MNADPRSSPPPDNRWFDQAAQVLANLGFESLSPDKSRDGVSHLLVAIRPAPTGEHYDPESIDYWTTDGLKGSGARLDADTRFPLAASYAWGQIVLTDRVAVNNEFLSFGGVLRARTTPDGTIVADFASPAPILRWGGHSQEPDPLASEIGAYFARLRVPIDFVAGSEELISKLSPQTLFCAFVQNTKERLAQSPGLREANGWLVEWVTGHANQLQTASDGSWQAAETFRHDLAALEAVARE